MRAPFPHARCLNDMGIDEKRRRREGFAKRPESLEILD